MHVCVCQGACACRCVCLAPWWPPGGLCQLGKVARAPGRVRDGHGAERHSRDARTEARQGGRWTGARPEIQGRTGGGLGWGKHLEQPGVQLRWCWDCTGLGRLSRVNMNGKVSIRWGAGTTAGFETDAAIRVGVQVRV